MSSFEIQGTLTGSTSKYFDCDGSNGTGTITVGSGTGACNVCTDDAGNCSLPVEYISINAEKTDDNTIELSWLTASEENNDYFIVQKSTDGINWIEISQVNGAGTSSTINNYSIIDENSSTGHNYYRLVQVDFDGRYEISKIVSVLLTNNIFLTVYPNPSQQSTGTFTVLVNGMDEDALFQLTVVDLTGKAWDVSTENENTNLVTVLHELAAGTYLVQVIIDNKRMIERLVIQ